ncbi:MAG TPA: SRPBCC domain-containing protein [Thermoanaerobaculia bacterium]|nr:SRPBCC domain-containing protein [Thermoanaerobaculia bacterium]
MRSRKWPALALAAAAAITAPMRAEVVDVANNGFAVKEAVAVNADASKAWAALVDVGKWWDPEHSYSGDGANITLDPKPGGCWCEKLPGGGVQHMTVVFADPGKLLRVDGGLGPLQGMAVSGVLTFTLKPADRGTTVELTYVVGGYSRSGFKDVAPGVDAVLGAQLSRYQRFVNGGKP